LFTLALTLGKPYLSTDVLSYLAEGHQVISGQNPYAVPLKTVGVTPYGRELAREGWPALHDVSPYGPLWTQMEAAADLATADVPTEVLLLKIVISAFSVAGGVMIWLILGRVSPRNQLLGTILYIVNPVVPPQFGRRG